MFKFRKTTNKNNSNNLPPKNRQKLLTPLSRFFNNPQFFLPLRIWLVLLGISFLLLGLTFKKLPPFVPLYYSLPWGEEQLTQINNLFIFPFSIVVVFLLNVFISLSLLKKDNFLVQLLLWTCDVFALFALITLTKIILLVI